MTDLPSNMTRIDSADAALLAGVIEDQWRRFATDNPGGSFGIDFPYKGIVHRIRASDLTRALTMSSNGDGALLATLTGAYPEIDLLVDVIIPFAHQSETNRGRVEALMGRIAPDRVDSLRHAAGRFGQLAASRVPEAVSYARRHADLGEHQIMATPSLPRDLVRRVVGLLSVYYNREDTIRHLFASAGLKPFQFLPLKFHSSFDHWVAIARRLSPVALRDMLSQAAMENPGHRDAFVELKVEVEGHLRRTSLGRSAHTEALNPTIADRIALVLGSRLETFDSILSLFSRSGIDETRMPVITGAISPIDYWRLVMDRVSYIQVRSLLRTAVEDFPEAVDLPQLRDRIHPDDSPFVFNQRRPLLEGPETEPSFFFQVHEDQRPHVGEMLDDLRSLLARLYPDPHRVRFLFQQAQVDFWRYPSFDSSESLYGFWGDILGRLSLDEMKRLVAKAISHHSLNRDLRVCAEALSKIILDPTGTELPPPTQVAVPGDSSPRFSFLFMATVMEPLSEGLARHFNDRINIEAFLYLSGIEPEHFPLEGRVSALDFWKNVLRQLDDREALALLKEAEYEVPDYTYFGELRRAIEQRAVSAGEAESGGSRSSRLHPAGPAMAGESEHFHAHDASTIRVFGSLPSTHLPSLSRRLVRAYPRVPGGAFSSAPIFGGGGGTPLPTAIPTGLARRTARLLAHYSGQSAQMVELLRAAGFRPEEFPISEFGRVRDQWTAIIRRLSPGQLKEFLLGCVFPRLETLQDKPEQEVLDEFRTAFAPYVNEKPAAQAAPEKEDSIPIADRIAHALASRYLSFESIVSLLEGSGLDPSRMPTFTRAITPVEYWRLVMDCLSFSQGCRLLEKAVEDNPSAADLRRLGSSVTQHDSPFVFNPRRPRFAEPRLEPSFLADVRGVEPARLVEILEGFRALLAEHYRDPQRVFMLFHTAGLESWRYPSFDGSSTPFAFWSAVLRCLSLDHMKRLVNRAASDTRDGYLRDYAGDLAPITLPAYPAEPPSPAVVLVSADIPPGRPYLMRVMGPVSEEFASRYYDDLSIETLFYYAGIDPERSRLAGPFSPLQFWRNVLENLGDREVLALIKATYADDANVFLLQQVQRSFEDALDAEQPAEARFPDAARKTAQAIAALSVVKAGSHAAGSSGSGRNLTIQSLVESARAILHRIREDETLRKRLSNNLGPDDLAAFRESLERILGELDRLPDSEVHGDTYYLSQFMERCLGVLSLKLSTKNDSSELEPLVAGLLGTDGGDVVSRAVKDLERFRNSPSGQTWRAAGEARNQLDRLDLKMRSVSLGIETGEIDTGLAVRGDLVELRNYGHYWRDAFANWSPPWWSPAGKKLKRLLDQISARIDGVIHVLGDYADHWGVPEKLFALHFELNAFVGSGPNLLDMFTAHLAALRQRREQAENAAAREGLASAATAAVAGPVETVSRAQEHGPAGAIAEVWTGLAEVEPVAPVASAAVSVDRTTPGPGPDPDPNLHRALVREKIADLSEVLASLARSLWYSPAFADSTADQGEALWVMEEKPADVTAVQWGHLADFLATHEAQTELASLLEEPFRRPLLELIRAAAGRENNYRYEEISVRPPLRVTGAKLQGHLASSGKRIVVIDGTSIKEDSIRDGSVASGLKALLNQLNPSETLIHSFGSGPGVDLVLKTARDAGFETSVVCGQKSNTSEPESPSPFADRAALVADPAQVSADLGGSTGVFILPDTSYEGAHNGALRGALLVLHAGGSVIDLTSQNVLDRERRTGIPTWLQTDELNDHQKGRYFWECLSQLDEGSTATIRLGKLIRSLTYSGSTLTLRHGAEAALEIWGVHFSLLVESPGGPFNQNADNGITLRAEMGELAATEAGKRLLGKLESDLPELMILIDDLELETSTVRDENGLALVARTKDGARLVRPGKSNVYLEVRAGPSSTYSLEAHVPEFWLEHDRLTTTRVFKWDHSRTMVQSLNDGTSVAIQMWDELGEDVTASKWNPPVVIADGREIRLTPEKKGGTSVLGGRIYLKRDSDTVIELVGERGARQILSTGPRRDFESGSRLMFPEGTSVRLDRSGEKVLLEFYPSSGSQIQPHDVAGMIRTSEEGGETIEARRESPDGPITFDITPYAGRQSEIEIRDLKSGMEMTVAMEQDGPLFWKEMARAKRPYRHADETDNYHLEIDRMVGNPSRDGGKVTSDLLRVALTAIDQNKPVVRPRIFVDGKQSSSYGEDEDSTDLLPIDRGAAITLHILSGKDGRLVREIRIPPLVRRNPVASEKTTGEMLPSTPPDVERDQTRGFFAPSPAEAAALTGREPVPVVTDRPWRTPVSIVRTEQVSRPATDVREAVAAEMPDVAGEPANSSSQSELRKRLVGKAIAADLREVAEMLATLDDSQIKRLRKGLRHWRVVLRHRGHGEIAKALPGHVSRSDQLLLMVAAISAKGDFGKIVSRLLPSGAPGLPSSTIPTLGAASLPAGTPANVLIGR